MYIIYDDMLYAVIFHKEVKKHVIDMLQKTCNGVYARHNTHKPHYIFFV